MCCWRVNPGFCVCYSNTLPTELCPQPQFKANAIVSFPGWRPEGEKKPNKTKFYCFLIQLKKKYEYVCTQVCRSLRKSERLECQAAVSCHVYTENWSLVFCKSSKGLLITELSLQSHCIQFLKSLKLLYLSVCVSMYMYVDTMEFRGGGWISWNWNERMFVSPAMWMLGIELGSSERISSTLNHWTNSPAPPDTYLL